MNRHRPWWLDQHFYGVLWNDVVTIWTVGYTGIPVACVQFPAGGLRGLRLLWVCERHVIDMLDRNANRRVVGGPAGVVKDEEWSVLYPMLFAHLSQTSWPDGQVRQVSTLSVFADGDIVKCVLKDREAGLCLWAACPSFCGLFGVLEALLVDPGAEWRVDRTTPGQKASRVKR